jgi:hypothetical protein
MSHKHPVHSHFINYEGREENRPNNYNALNQFRCI